MYYGLHGGQLLTFRIFWSHFRLYLTTSLRYPALAAFMVLFFVFLVPWHLMAFKYLCTHEDLICDGLEK
jgi:membrane protein CcdC involved in cytochrome C biogenesis